MKAVIIGVERALTCLGARYVSAALKAAGHESRMLFLAREFDDFESAAELEQVVGWLREQDPDLIGISLMSSHLRRVQQLTSAIRKAVQAPILWGGIHPTTDPERCLEQADIVCVGEGEDAVVELADRLAAGKGYGDVANLWLRRNGDVIRNPARPRRGDLDAIPFPDYELEDQFILHEGKVVPKTERVMAHYHYVSDGCHYAITTRGCPFNCSYCCNTALRRVADGPYVRRRSVENIIRELREILERFEYVRSIAFWDDSFTSGDPRWLEEFCARYKREIGLPFFCNLQPLAVTRERVSMLVDAGLLGIHMGFQTGSEYVNREVFNRRVEAEQFLAATRVLDEFRDRLVDRHYHVIVDNPYEPERELVHTARYVARFSKPYYLSLCTLMYYPSTTLYERAVADGLITPETNPVYDYEYYRHRRTYLNLVMRSAPVTPRGLTEFFIEQRRNPFVKLAFFFYYYGYYHLRYRLLGPLWTRWRGRRADRAREKISATEYTLIKALRRRRM
jgi:radical SAM superfamily enzyme YgiQ (UPF0313 family)